MIAHTVLILLSLSVTKVFSQSDACLFPPQVGVCRALIPSFYFNHQTGVCDCYPFGGCGAGPNHFSSFQACMQVCNVPQELQYFSAECERLFGSALPSLPQRGPNPQTQNSANAQRPPQARPVAPAPQQPISAAPAPQPAISAAPQQAVSAVAQPAISAAPASQQQAPASQQQQTPSNNRLTPEAIAELQKIIGNLSPSEVQLLENEIQAIIRRNNAQQNEVTQSQQPIRFQPSAASQPSAGVSNVQSSPPRASSAAQIPINSFNDDSSKEAEDQIGLFGKPLQDTRPSVISLKPVATTFFSSTGMTTGQISVGQPVNVPQ